MRMIVLRTFSVYFFSVSKKASIPEDGRLAGVLESLVGAVPAVVASVAHVGLEHAAAVVAAVVVGGARHRAARRRLVRQVLAVRRACPTHVSSLLHCRLVRH